MEACFAARLPQEDTGRGAPTAQEFITKTTQERRDSRAMRGDRRSPGAAPHPGENVGPASASISQGATGPHLRSSSGLRAWDVARAHHTSMFACHSACRVWQPPSSATCGASWRLIRPGITQSWQRWRRSSRNRLDPQSLPRLRAPVAREEQPLHPASSAASTPLQQQNQVTSSKFI